MVHNKQLFSIRSRWIQKKYRLHREQERFRWDIMMNFLRALVREQTCVHTHVGECVYVVKS